MRAHAHVRTHTLFQTTFKHTRTHFCMQNLIGFVIELGMAQAHAIRRLLSEGSVIWRPFPPASHGITLTYTETLPHAPMIWFLNEMFNQVCDSAKMHATCFPSH